MTYTLEDLLNGGILSKSDVMEIVKKFYENIEVGYDLKTSLFLSCGEKCSDVGVSPYAVTGIF